MAPAEVLAGTVGRTAGGPFGSNLVGRDYVSAGVPVVRGQNMNGRWVSGEFAFVSETKAKELSGNLAYPGDLVFTQRGTLGQVSLVPAEPYERYVLSQSQMKLAPDSAKADPLFLYYVFSSAEQRAHIRRNAVQSGVPHTNLAFLRATPVRLPPLGEQRAIAGVLGALDDKIELNRRMSETLEETAELLFTREFGGVAEVTLAEEFQVTMGQSPPGETYNEIGEGIAFFQGRADFGYRFPTDRVYCTAPTRYAAAGDTLVSVRAPVGDVNMALGDCAIGRGVAAVRHRSGSRSVTYYAMRRLRCVFEVFESEGTVFGSLSKKDFARILVPRLSDHAEAFELLVRPMDDRIEASERESRTLAELRDTLLPKLISGEVRVPRS